ncbi:hypothetical protein [Sorangium sp. So ce1000]|uniref:hypothetical protein n=1 Tax=Sorangium sp. So ce1000 TaxID=3133325 RepID=UPI003F6095AF
MHRSTGGPQHRVDLAARGECDLVEEVDAYTTQDRLAAGRSQGHRGPYAGVALKVHGELAEQLGPAAVLPRLLQAIDREQKADRLGLHPVTVARVGSELRGRVLDVSGAIWILHRASRPSNISAGRRRFHGVQDLGEPGARLVQSLLEDLVPPSERAIPGAEDHRWHLAAQLLLDGMREPMGLSDARRTDVGAEESRSAPARPRVAKERKWAPQLVDTALQVLADAACGDVEAVALEIEEHPGEPSKVLLVVLARLQALREGRGVTERICQRPTRVHHAVQGVEGCPAELLRVRDAAPEHR